MSRTAFLFSGQGQQVVGMASDLCETFETARRTLEEADEALGEPLSQLIAQGPAEELTLTANAQPALLAVSTAYARVLDEHLVVPNVVAGHSLGEYTALVVAGSLDFADAVRVVRRRGELMQEAVPAGEAGMVALVGADVFTAEEVCRRVGAEGGRVEIAADNCPGNVVISGSLRDLRRAGQLARGLDVHDAVPLAVSAPFHSAALVPAAEALAETLAATPLAPPRIAFFANVTALPMADPDRIRDNLVRQVFMPLRWRQSVERILAVVDRVVQVGPGRALLGHVKRIQRRFPVFASEDVGDRDRLLSAEGP